MADASVDDDDLAGMLDATAALLGLTVAPEWRGEILFYMRASSEAAKRLMEFPLEDTAEPAPVFIP